MFVSFRSPLHPVMSTILLLIQRIALIFVQKFFQFILPLPFLPAVTDVLAKLVGIDSRAFQPVTLPKMALPHISIIPASPRVLPFAPPALENFLPKFKKSVEVTKDDVTIPLGEKIQTWRQNHMLAQATSKQKPLVSLEEFTSIGRKRIDHVDFGEEVQHTLGEMAEEAVHSAQALVSPFSIKLIHLIPAIAPVTADTPSHVLHDQDYARQSSEKQVFEKSQNQPESVTSQKVHPPTPPDGAPVAAVIQPIKSHSHSPASSVYLAPQAGEVGIPLDSTDGRSPRSRLHSQPLNPLMRRSQILFPVPRGSNAIPAYRICISWVRWCVLNPGNKEILLVTGGRLEGQGQVEWRSESLTDAKELYRSENARDSGE